MSLKSHQSEKQKKVETRWRRMVWGESGGRIKGVKMRRKLGEKKRGIFSAVCLAWVRPLGQHQNSCQRTRGEQRKEWGSDEGTRETMMRNRRAERGWIWCKRKQIVRKCVFTKGECLFAQFRISQRVKLLFTNLSSSQSKTLLQKQQWCVIYVCFFIRLNMWEKCRSFSRLRRVSRR